MDAFAVARYTPRIANGSVAVAVAIEEEEEEGDARSASAAAASPRVVIAGAARAVRRAFARWAMWGGEAFSRAVTSDEGRRVVRLALKQFSSVS
jgi:hypothetical protein